MTKEQQDAAIKFLDEKGFTLDFGVELKDCPEFTTFLRKREIEITQLRVDLNRMLKRGKV